MQKKNDSLEAFDLFSPKQALRSSNQKIFTGRRDLIKNAIKQIALPGASIVLYGDKGVGKTSLGWQLLEIFKGNYSILEQLGITFPKKLKQYDCLWISCSSEMISIEGVLIELMDKVDYSKDNEFGNRNFFSIYPNIYNNKDVKAKVKETSDLNLGMFEVKHEFSEKISKEEQFTISNTRKNIFRTFKELLYLVESASDKDLIIFIDEFDRLPNKKGIGELIKVTASCSFVLIGVADNINDIIQDHRSVDRKILGSTFRVKGFSDPEIDEVFDKVEVQTSNKIKFSKSYRELIKKYCEGFAYLIQFVGYKTIEDLDLLKDKLLDAKEFHEAFKALVSEEGDTYRYELIRECVYESESREQILFIMSNLDEKWLTQKEIKDKLKDGQKENFNNHLRHLVECGILIKKNNEVKFEDPITKALLKYSYDNKITFLKR
jgi:hypothetical protein